MPPRLLVVSNQVDSTREPGLFDVLDHLVDSGHLTDYAYVATGRVAGEAPVQRRTRIVTDVMSARFDMVLALAPAGQLRDVPQVLDLVADRPLVYWEGDAWGRGKPIPESMGAWLTASEWVFSVAGEPQTSLLRRHGARVVLPTVNTYDHLLFAEEERAFDGGQPAHACVFVGSNLARLPGVTGLPGSRDRRKLVMRLRRRLGTGFDVAGSGWPRRIGASPVPFAQLGRFIRSGHVLANWSHYPRNAGSASDRLAVAMISGRAQITTLHPGMDWLPGEDSGVFLRSSPRAVEQTVLDLLEDPQRALDLGEAAWTWARKRLSLRQALTYMLSFPLETLPAPEIEPWSRLPHLPW